jgi:hypothetical protein
MPPPVQELSSLLPCGRSGDKPNLTKILLLSLANYQEKNKTAFSLIRIKEKDGLSLDGSKPSISGGLR